MSNENGKGAGVQGIVGAGIMVLAGCSSEGLPQGANETKSPSEAKSVISHSLVLTQTDRSGTPKEMTIASLPNAACNLKPLDRADSRSLPVWADDVGLVHLWAPARS